MILSASATAGVCMYSIPVYRSSTFSRTMTMSSFLPNIVVSKAMTELKLEDTINTPELKKKIAAGMDRLYDFQHEDGGWGWWKDDESHVFMTAYVVNGLAQAKAAGYNVREDALENGKNWLVRSIEKYPRMRADLHAYVLYSITSTGVRDPKLIEAVWDKRDKMSVQGLAFLGLALHAAGDMRAAQLARAVAGIVLTLGTIAYLVKGAGLFLWGALATTVPLILGMFVAKYLFRFHDALTLGIVSGSRTTTASLGLVCDIAKSQVPALGYTVTYAVGNTLLTIWGLVIILLLT